MPSARNTSEPARPQSTDSAAPRPAGDIAADAALALAALGRIQTAAYSDRATLERLREALGVMANSIAQAKATLFAAVGAEGQPDMAMLLDQLEHQVDAMIETAGGTATAEPKPEVAPQPVAPPAAETETEQVPTVSGVVSGLGNSEPAAADASAAPAAADTASEQIPNVAMLKAMVEALSASVPQALPDVAVPEAAEALPPPAEPEPPAAEAQPQIVEPAPSAVEAQAQPAAPAPPPPIEIAMQELLASYERMEARPIPPPDEGTAVIFAPKPEPPAPAERAAAGPPAPAVEAAATTADIADAVEVSPVVAEAVHAAVDTLQAVVTALPASAEVAPAAAEAPQAIVEVPPSTETAAAPPVDTEFDPTDFLFGPEPEPDPAAFLLEPEPPSQSASAPLPSAEPVATPAAAEPAELQSVEIDKPESTQPGPTTADPLAPLNAMSEAERIAIFS